MRGGQVNGGSWQHSWLFLWLVSTDITSWTVPGSPSLRSCPWKHSPFGSHLDFTALLPPSRLSDSAGLEDAFLPSSSPAKGVGDGEGREERGIAASQVAAVAGMLCPGGARVGCCRPMQLITLIGTCTVPPVLPLPTKPRAFLCPGVTLPSLWLHTASPGHSKEGSELLQDHGSTKQFTERKRGKFSLYQMPISTPLETTPSLCLSTTALHPW